MSILLTYILAQIFIIYVSAMAIPPSSAATIQLWDIERATSFNALLEATTKNARPALDVKSVAYSIEPTSTSAANIIKRRSAARNAKHLPKITDMPMGGMQCAVM
jgi:hypothetical protein